MDRNSQVESWYVANATKIKKFANKRSMQDAEDILQDTAVKLLVNPAEWAVISQRETTKRAMSEYYNPERGFKGAGEAKLVNLDAVATQPSPVDMESELYAKKCVELVTELVDSVKGAGKDIFLMHFFQDMGYDEIAAALNMDHKSCKQLGYRAKSIIVDEFKRRVDK